MTERVDIDADRLRFLLAEVNEFGALPDGGVQRIAWTDPEVAAREWLLDRCVHEGLEAEQDEAGNIWIWGGTKPAVVMGSHLDTVPNGGCFDGALGVVAALEVLTAARRAGVRAADRLAMVCFTDEEGVRFTTGMTGSRAVAGTLGPEELRSATTAEGDRLVDILAERGLDPEQFLRAGNRRAAMACYLELHIEQGRRLESGGEPVGVVSAIAGLSSWHVKVHGESNHAGTTQLADRRDAMLPVARTVLEARQLMRTVPGLVATVGDARVVHGAGNIVPGLTECSLDVRSTDEGKIEAATQRLLAVLQSSAADNGCRVETEQVKRLASVRLDPSVMAAIKAAGPGADAPVLDSMAGHDAMSLAAAGVPCGMVFVRSRDGMSHCPQEYSSEPDCAHGAQWLADAALLLAREHESG